MSIENDVQVVKDFFAAIGGYNKQDLLALVAADIEWIIPGEDWPLAGTHRGHAGLAAVLQKASETVETSFPEPPEFVAQGDRVLDLNILFDAHRISPFSLRRIVSDLIGHVVVHEAGSHRNLRSRFISRT